MLITRPLGLAVLLLTATACGPLATSTTGAGPLGPPAPGGDICWAPRPGQMLTSGELVDTNWSSHRVTLTGAWLTGTRDLRQDAAYADILPRGHPAAGDLDGWPPAALRHPLVGTVVPPGGSVNILYTVTGLGRSAFAAKEVVRYSSLGTPYEQPNLWSIGWGKLCSGR
jgi:hypothetical protein